MGDSDEDLADELGLKAGAVVESGKAKYVIDGLLGEGGFGAVFRVHDPDNPGKAHAMKVEKKIETRRHSKLKMEIAILKLVSQQRAAERSHFTAIVDRGKKEKFFFLVMQMVGKSLADLKSLRPGRIFSMGTGISAAIQCLEACEDLHAHDFIHRDLKPANYAIGLGDMQRVVYILDFGIARKLASEGHTLKTPRLMVAFKGTVRFASIACHKNIEMGYKDDCESWFYLLIDLILAGGLPWAKCQDKDEVLRTKRDSRDNHASDLVGQLGKCKDELWKVLDYVDHLSYFDRVDYSYIYALLKLAAKNSDADLEAPYDWEDTKSVSTGSVKKSSSEKPDQSTRAKKSKKL